MKLALFFSLATWFSLFQSSVVQAFLVPPPMCDDEAKTTYFLFADPKAGNSMWLSKATQTDTVVFVDHGSGATVTARRLKDDAASKLRELIGAMYDHRGSPSFGIKDVEAVMAAYTRKRFVRRDQFAKDVVDCMTKGVG